MKNRPLFLLLSVLMIFSMLASCTTQATQAPKPTEAPAAQEAPAAATTAPAEKPFAGQELNMIYFDATYARAAEKYIPEFEE
ncbi:MAG: hypothetical protein H6Q37_2531, partial [Chloroflexi bacterium]|nr:hypothetical protein [Chloroflexota bacterium]